MTPEFTKERDALRATNRQLAEANAALTARVAEFDAVCESLHQTRAEAAGLETDLKEARTLNAQLAAQVDDARRQRDECAAALEALRAALDAVHERQTPLTEAAAVVERWAVDPTYLVACVPGGVPTTLTTETAAVLVTALLADGRVHERWLHGRGGK